MTISYRPSLRILEGTLHFLLNIEQIWLFERKLYWILNVSKFINWNQNYCESSGWGKMWLEPLVVTKLIEHYSILITGGMPWSLAALKRRSNEHLFSTLMRLEGETSNKIWSKIEHTVNTTISDTVGAA